MQKIRPAIRSLCEKLAFVGIHGFLIAAIGHSYSKWYATQPQQPPPLWRAYYIFYGLYAFIILLIVNLSYMIFYLGKFRMIERYKIQPGPWPWEGSSFFSKHNVESMKNVAFSMVFVLNGISAVFSLTIRPEMAPEKLPSLWYHLFCVAVNYFCEDFFFYFTHLLLHTPWIYKRVHKRHHNSRQIICLATLDNHWVETVLSGFTTFSGSYILGRRQHFISMMVFASMRVWESHDVHSGYKLPFSVFNLSPFMIDPPYHDFHHSHNIGNYSMTLKLWDWYFGTSKNYDQFQKDKVEVEAACSEKDG